MAGDWIKMRKSLLADPRVVRISSAINADRFRTIGGLFAAWCLMDEQTADGVLDGYTVKVFDELVGIEGLAVAMEMVGWLEIGEDYVKAPEFCQHNGKSAKRRDSETARKTSARNADKNRTESALEKRREEKKENTGEASPLEAPKPKANPKPTRDQLVAIPLPASHNTPAIRKAFDEFLDNRIALKKCPTVLAVQKLIETLASQKPEHAVPMINKAIASGWTGLFPLSESDLKSQRLPPAQDKAIPPEHRPFPKGGVINAFRRESQ